MTQYIQLIGRMDAEPHGAAATTPKPVSLPPVGTTGCVWW